MKKELSHKELLEKVARLDPLLIQAIDEVDCSMFDDFKKLSIEQKITQASSLANSLGSFKKV